MDVNDNVSNRDVGNPKRNDYKGNREKLNTENIFSAYDQLVKVSKDSFNKISNDTIIIFDKMYGNLEIRHTKYLDAINKSEIKTYEMLTSQIYDLYDDMYKKLETRSASYTKVVTNSLSSANEFPTTVSNDSASNSINKLNTTITSLIKLLSEEGMSQSPSGGSKKKNRRPKIKGIDTSDKHQNVLDMLSEDYKKSFYGSYESQNVEQYALKNEVSYAEAEATVGENGFYSFIADEIIDIGKNVGAIAEKSVGDASKDVGEVAKNTALGTALGVALVGAVGLAFAPLILLLEAIKLYTDNIKEGVEAIRNQYKESYQTFSVFSGGDSETYFNALEDIRNQLYDMDLEDNISQNAVIKKMSDNLSKGIDYDRAMSKAFDDAIYNIISPNLDTQSKAFTDLQLALGDKFAERFVGMTANVQSIAGSSRVLQDSLNETINKITPIELLAKEQLMSGEEFAFVESLVNQGLMTESQAVELVSQASSVVADQYGTLMSGNVAQQYAIATGQATNLENAIYGMLEGIGRTLGNVSDNYLMKGASISALGVGGFLNQASQIDDIWKFAQNYDFDSYAEKQEEDAYERLQQRLAEDELQVEDDMYKVLKENSDVASAMAEEGVTIDGYLFNIMELVASIEHWLTGKTAKETVVGAGVKVSEFFEDIADYMGISATSKHAEYLNENDVGFFAEGGYVEANSPQLAVVGDNKNYGEIIAPEPKLIEAVRKGISESVLLKTAFKQDYSEIIVAMQYVSTEIVDAINNQGSLRRDINSHLLSNGNQYVMNDDAKSLLNLRPIIKGD